MDTTQPDYWISPRDLDAGGNAVDLPVVTGTFDGEGRPTGSYPKRVGMASAKTGHVTFNGEQYLVLNLVNKYRAGQVVFSLLVSTDYMDCLNSLRDEGFSILESVEMLKGMK